jgi:hypothetical protein
MRGDPELLPKAEAAVERGLATGHGEAYLASAQYQLNRGNAVRGAQDCARALVRAPMSAQAHELAAKILVEDEGMTNARQHFETARGLDPGRANIIDGDLTRVDALEQKWEDADARNARLVADPDTSIQQLGLIQRARLDCWRGRTDTLLGSSKSFLARVSPNAGAIFKIVAIIHDSGRIDPALWRTIIDDPCGPAQPQRQHLVRMQMFCELAMALGDLEKSIDGLERLSALGFMDKIWLDHCPLVGIVAETERYAVVRREVNERAAQVLAAFRAISA